MGYLSVKLRQLCISGTDGMSIKCVFAFLKDEAGDQVVCAPVPSIANNTLQLAAFLE